MQDGICPKCGSHEVFMQQTRSRNIMLGNIGLAVTAVHVVVCAECGYMEEYILNEDFLNKVRAKWQRVGERQPQP